MTILVIAGTPQEAELYSRWRPAALRCVYSPEQLRAELQASPAVKRRIAVCTGSFWLNPTYDSDVMLEAERAKTLAVEYAQPPEDAKLALMGGKIRH